MKRLTVYALIGALAIMTALAWARGAVTCVEVCMEAHQATLAGTYVSPFQYRILAPVLAEQFGGGAGGYFVLHLLAAFALFVGLWRLGGLLPVAIVAAVLPLMFASSWGWMGIVSLIEAAAWAWMVVLLRARRRDELLWLALLIAVAALNRETTVFLVVMYAAVRRRVNGTILLGGAFMLVYGAIRLHFGSAPDMVTVQQAWEMNTGGGWWTMNALLNNALLLPLFALAVSNWKRVGLVERRAALVVPAYIGAVAVFGLWNEVRLLLPLFALTAGALALPLGERERI
jgi:hypothetical protein